MTAEKTVELADLAATSHFGARLAKLLFPASVVGLVGPLGAGKTHLVRAIAEGLGIADGRLVTSPTFVLIQEYRARLPIYHFDAYRLASAGEFLDLGVNEYFESQGVCLIEWADKVEKCLPGSWLRIGFTVTGPTSRLLTLEGHGTRYESIIARLA